MLKGQKKHTDKEQCKTKHEAPRSVNYRATQNNNSIGSTALERSVVYTAGGLKASLHKLHPGSRYNSYYKKIWGGVLLYIPYLWISKSMYFWISLIRFWISKNRFMDILKYIFGYPKICCILDINNSIFGYPKMNYGYPKINTDFWISKYQFLDNQKSVEYWISIIRYINIQKWITDILKYTPIFENP